VRQAVFFFTIILFLYPSPLETDISTSLTAPLFSFHHPSTATLFSRQYRRRSVDINVYDILLVAYRADCFKFRRFG
jgi:hypothetical protein